MRRVRRIGGHEEGLLAAGVDELEPGVVEHGHTLHGETREVYPAQLAAAIRSTETGIDPREGEDIEAGVVDAATGYRRPDLPDCRKLQQEQSLLSLYSY